MKPLICIFMLATLSSQAQTYFDVVTYNIEWLGRPDKAGLSITRDQQLTLAAQDIIAAEADIYALQEIVTDPVNGDALTDLVSKLNALDVNDTWAGAYNTYFSYWWNPDYNAFPAQRQAYVYRNSTVSNVTFQTLLTTEVPEGDNRFASGRLPFMMEADLTIEGITQHVYLVNLHLKCCTGSAARRKSSMQTLVTELNANYSTVNVMVLGDFNVADVGGAYGEISTWGIYDDNDTDGLPDYEHAAGAIQDLAWDDIDHILASNELQDEYLAAPSQLRNQQLSTSVSDHFPIKTVMAFGTPPPTNQPPMVDITAPLNNSSYDQGTLVAINANATDNDGTIASVEFFVNTISIGSDNTAPYSINWTVGTGSFALTAVAIDNQTAQTTSNIVTVTGTTPGGGSVLTYDDFENGWGNWADGGSDCNFYTGGNYAHQGLNAANIQDNSGVSSSFSLTTGLDVTSFSQLKVEFWYYSKRLANGEDFWLQYYDGSSWITVRSLVKGTDFENNNFYFETVTLEAGVYSFPANASFRFMCDASGNSDDIYIDEISISGSTVTPLTARKATSITSTTSSDSKEEVEPESMLDFIVYPNPVEGELLTIAVKSASDETTVEIYDMNGKLYLSKSLTLKVSQLPLEGFNTGVYLIIIHDTINIKTQRIIIK
jgi:endonuclease/exonuclease/phosphatase family metal-dependent hydrolase